MEYSGNKLTKMSGVSARTLRYYDSIGLLKPKRVAASGYRIYGRDQVDQLQQILIYRELGFALQDIKQLTQAPGFDRARALRRHLAELLARRERLDAMIRNVTTSIEAMKGETTMNDAEKFEGFKQNLIDENERKYGAEARLKYGDDEVNASNAQVKGMTKDQYDHSERLLAEFEAALGKAFAEGEPAGEAAQRACDLHRQWLTLFYPKYSKGYHIGLAEMYVADERFRAHYDEIAPGCTEFLREAIMVYCGE